MANITHPEIKRLILENYPSAKVILLNEIGSAGPYPAPGVKRKQKDEFEQNLKALKVDAVISGNGGCGLCTPKEEGSCITAEYIGIPSVMITAPGFVDQAKSTALAAGIPVQRVAIYPGAFTSHSKNELVKNTKEVLWNQIIEGLTKPISQEEIEESKKSIKDNTESVIFTGTLDEVQQYYEQNGMSDGIAIIPPTEDKINEFLKYTPLSKDTIIGIIPPSYRKITTKQIAIVGAMAGCPPEFMPILIAYTKAMMDGNFRRTLSSTHAWTPYIWLNGPITRQLGIDFEQGEISSPANKRLGRFIDLAMINLGGYNIKKNRMGTFGYLSSWAMAEDEEANLRIGWKPYHVQRGYNINENTLTAASALSWGNNLTPASSNPDKILELIAWDCVEKQQFALGSGTPFVYRTIFITEYVARDLARKYKNKDQLEQNLIKLARTPLDERTYANYWANPGSSFENKHYSTEQHKNKIRNEENAQITLTPKWLAWSEKVQIETVPVMTNGKTAIVITGDSNRNKVLTVPGGGMTTIKIELPQNWNTLMEKLGYKPLETYYLNSSTITNTNQANEQNQNTSENNTKSFSQNDNEIQNQYKNLYSNRDQKEKNYQQKRPKRPTPEQYRKLREQKNIKRNLP